MTPERLAGWVPIRVSWRDARPFVDWCRLGDVRFREPFFEQTIARCLRHPFNLAFRQETPIEALGERQAASPGMRPSGLVFHMSRCGSTLVAQMLAALPRCLMISEAPPLDQVLQAEASEEQRVEWLRWMMAALGRARHGEEMFFVKFDAWHVLALPLIARAFPNTPWIFLYRDPVEVLVSQTRERGLQVIPSAMPPARFGLAEEPWLTKLDEYAARVLGRISAAAWENRGQSRGRFVNFTELPEAVPELLRDWFRVSLSREEDERLRSVARFDAKRPGVFFQTDSAAKQRAASAELKRHAEEFIRPAYDRLERTRPGKVI